jgi:hypothetical protein
MPALIALFASYWQARETDHNPMDDAWSPNATCEDPVSSGRGAPRTGDFDGTHAAPQDCARPATAKTSFRKGCKMVSGESGSSLLN